MKTFVVIFMVFMTMLSLKACAETLTVHGDTANTDANRAYHLQRFAEYGKQVEAELQRKHEKDIEVAKFANALLLEYASAPKVNVSVRQSNTQQVQTRQSVRQTVEL